MRNQVEETRSGGRADPVGPVMIHGKSDCRGGEGGFALLVALLAIVGLTVMATGGFLLADSERQTSENYVTVVEAFYLANTGLSDFVGTSRGFPASSWSQSYEKGSVDVTTTQIATDASGLRVYRVTATGNYDAPRGGQVSRTVGTVVTAEPADLKLPNSALFSGGGVRKNGAAGEITGEDASMAGECPDAGQPTRPGVTTADGEYDGKQDALEGDPPLLQIPESEMQDSAKVDWPGLLSGDALQPDVVLSSESSDSWPDSFPSGDWPVIRVEESGSWTLPSDGQGILIVENGLTLNGNVEWKGPVLVGGSITSNGNNTIEGAVVTGLNEVFFGEDVAGDDIEDTLNGTKVFKYHACNLWRARMAKAVLSEQEAAWFEDL